jgi:hypothetical protein
MSREKLSARPSLGVWARTRKLASAPRLVIDGRASNAPARSVFARIFGHQRRRFS